MQHIYNPARRSCGLINPRTGTAPLALCFAMLCLGCVSRDDPGNGPVELPGIGQTGPAPGQVYAVVIRTDLPLNQPTDKAWELINEQVVPPITRGAWRGNGLRIGLLRRDQLAELDQAIPPDVGSSKSIINQSEHPVPIIETTRLRRDMQFEIDLTRPPKPLKIETIKGEKNSSLRLLARIETEADGRQTLVLTPQHHIPSPLLLIPRDPREKEMDGRVFDELSVRLTLTEDQIVMVGMYWPWPEPAGRVDADNPDRAEAGDGSNESPEPAIAPADPGDPAAPPAHLNPGQDQPGKTKGSPDGKPAGKTPADKRLAPPLPMNFGTTLLTRTRFGKPVRTLLLITVKKAPEQPTPAP